MLANEDSLAIDFDPSLTNKPIFYNYESKT